MLNESVVKLGRVKLKFEVNNVSALVRMVIVAHFDVYAFHRSHYRTHGTYPILNFYLYYYKIQICLPNLVKGVYIVKCLKCMWYRYAFTLPVVSFYAQRWKLFVMTVEEHLNTIHTTLCGRFRQLKFFKFLSRLCQKQ